MRFSMPFQLKFVLISSVILWSSLLLADEQTAKSDTSSRSLPQITVRTTQDFELTGDGNSKNWSSAEWIEMKKRATAGHTYTTRFKALYSETGIYFVFDGTDSRLTATLTDDFDNLWTEDVFEVFLWTDESYPIYFEYEISPLNKELPILIPNFGGRFLGWRPWRYTGNRRTRTNVSIRGGPATSGARIKGWTAETFIPYVLLSPLNNVPPQSGTTWRANMYRVDYDPPAVTQWDWARVGPSFHEFEKFGTLLFE